MPVCRSLSRPGFTSLLPVVAAAIVVVLLPVTVVAAAQADKQDELVPCGVNTACEVGERTYRARPPSGWNGETRLPVLLHFHGWGRSGRHVLNNARTGGAAEANGMLIVAPDGLGKSWDFWTAESVDVPFVEAMMTDVAKRWPIDQQRIYVSGFSWGGAMAWRVACAYGNRFAAYLPVAGVLPDGEWQACEAGPASIVYVHGRKDLVVDLPIGPDGSDTYSLDAWLQRAACPAEPAAARDFHIYNCRTWAGCESGNTVELCTHRFGHLLPKTWLRDRLAEFLAPPS